MKLHERAWASRAKSGPGEDIHQGPSFLFIKPKSGVSLKKAIKLHLTNNNKGNNNNNRAFLVCSSTQKWQF